MSLPKIVFNRLADGRAQVVGLEQLVVHHSPDGFEWGYGGSGPSDLALNLLECYLQTVGYSGARHPCYKGECFWAAWRLHQAFKHRVIMLLPVRLSHYVFDWRLLQRFLAMEGTPELCQCLGLVFPTLERSELDALLHGTEGRGRYKREASLQAKGLLTTSGRLSAWGRRMVELYSVELPTIGEQRS